jgi:gamma-glutamylcyclotransferase (GGCT)/AIG2-like uncharacterized protein YtfP
MTNASTAEYLVVYGTLLQEVGHPCHSILAELSEFAGPATFHGALYDLGEYPGVLISHEPSEVVQSELYRLTHPQGALIKLDAYESHYPHDPSSSLFRREAIEVLEAGRKSLRAWVYCYNRSLADKPRIMSGDYLHFLRTRRALRRA